MTASRRSIVAVVLALALVAVLALGLVHRVAHGPSQAHQVDSLAHAHNGIEAHGHGEASALFGAHEEGGVECRLFDQAVHADALKAAAWPAWPPRVPATMPVCAPAIGAEAHAHEYLARGPPAGHRAGSRAA